jgi:acyl-CoA reductase-like NAD-dependent aldehyde dehydrogenase
MKPQDNQTVLLSLAKFIEENQKDILYLEENAIPSISVDICKYYAGATRTLISVPQHEYFKTCTSSMRWEPIGHCLGVIPSNYPLIIALWKIAPAIAAGCSIDIKLNPENPGSLPWILENWKEHKSRVKIIDEINFSDYSFIDLTGSHKTAEYFKSKHYNVNADTGGASIAVINDGNLTWIKKNLEWSIKYNNGQDCTAPKHIFCKTQHVNWFASIEGVSVGDPENLDHFNPTATISTYDSIDSLIEQINTYKNRLGLHLYTNDLSVQRYVSQHAKWGTIFVNKPLTVPLEMPHSGLGMSGNTFNQSFLKIYQYLVPKHIVIGDQVD